MTEFYVVFTGTIMVHADDWNEAEKEAKKKFPTKGITSSRILGICKKNRK